MAGSFVVSRPFEARAQEGATGDSATASQPMAPADSAAIAAAMAASDSALAEAQNPGAASRAAAANRARLELGVAMPKGYFDWLGTIGYRRRLLTDSRFQHWLQAEGMFGKKDYLSEGAVGVGWYIRP
ncbi:MAG TPA: hypothetical protein VI198_02215, partial [Candidatus Eisenbacteria bacterium]